MPLMPLRLSRALSFEATHGRPPMRLKAAVADGARLKWFYSTGCDKPLNLFVFVPTCRTMNSSRPFIFDVVAYSPIPSSSVRERASVTTSSDRSSRSMRQVSVIIIFSSMGPPGTVLILSS